jgi:hypothetical protein
VPKPATAQGVSAAGSTGALRGAAVAPVFEVIALFDRRSYDNAARIVYSASLETGRTGREIALWAQSNDRRLTFTVTAVQAALTTLNEQKLDGLARLFVRNLNDDSRIDADTVMITVLADLETPHIRILHSWVGENPSEYVLDASPPPSRDWAMSQLQLKWPEYGGLIAPLVATLERHRLVTEVPPAGRGDPVWRITDFGLECLRFLRQGPVTPGVV